MCFQRQNLCAIPRFCKCRVANWNTNYFTRSLRAPGSCYWVPSTMLHNVFKTVHPAARSAVLSTACSSFLELKLEAWTRVKTVVNKPAPPHSVSPLPFGLIFSKGPVSKTGTKENCNSRLSELSEWNHFPAKIYHNCVGGLPGNSKTDWFRLVALSRLFVGFRLFNPGFIANEISGF